MKPARAYNHYTICLTQGCGRTDLKGRGLCVRCYDKWIGPVRVAKWKKTLARQQRSKRKLGHCMFYGCSQLPFVSVTSRKYAMCAMHREQQRIIALNYSRTPESIISRSLSHHLYLISHERGTYKGMPFFPAWNPKIGGSIREGVHWILQNIGARPNDGQRWDLHIIDRPIGVVPDNLCWVPRDQHRREELLNKLLIENQQLKKRVADNLLQVLD